MDHSAKKQDGLKMLAVDEEPLALARHPRGLVGGGGGEEHLSEDRRGSRHSSSARIHLHPLGAHGDIDDQLGSVDQVDNPGS